MCVDIGLHHLANLVFVRFFHCKVTFPFFLWKEVTICSPHREWTCVFPSLKMAIYINYLESFCIKGLPLLPPFISLSSHLIRSVQLPEYLFILWIISQYYFILLLKLPQHWPLGALSVGSFVLFLIYFFLAVLGLHCGLFSSYSAQTSHCGDFSRPGAQALGCAGLMVVALEAQLLLGIWDLPKPGIQAMSHSLAARFFTTGSPGKPSFGF